MEFNGQFTVDGTPEELWKYFTDPEILQDAAPGCEQITLESPSRLTAKLAVGVGSVKPSFDVEGVVTETDRPNRLEIQASGEASRNSFEVTAWQELTGNDDGTTTVGWGAEAQISGILASMGERAIGSVTDNLVNEFFRNLEDHVNAGTPAESKLEAADEEALAGASDGAASQAEAADESPGLGTAEPGGPQSAVTQAVSRLAAGEQPGPAVALGGGIALAVVGSALRRWLRTPSDAVRHTTGEGSTTDAAVPMGRTGESRLTVALAFALGAALALLWERSDDGAVAHAPSGDATEAVDEESMPDEQERAESDEQGISDSTSDEHSTDGTTGHTPDLESDDPLDWLESR